MGTIANAKVTHYYNCYNGDFIGCLQKSDWIRINVSNRFLFMMFTIQFAFHPLVLHIPSHYHSM